MPETSAMLKNLTILVVFCLSCLLFSSCNRATYFDGSLFTYAQKPIPEGQIMISRQVFDGVPFRIFESNEFWQKHAELNSHQSESEITDLRERVSVLSPKFFSYQNENFAKWTIRVFDGHPSIFESLCRTYRIHHRELIWGPNNVSSFLKNRERLIREELEKKTESLENVPSKQQEQRVRILRNNLTQIQEAITRLAAEQESAHTKRIGAIAEQLMALDSKTK